MRLLAVTVLFLLAPMAMAQPNFDTPKALTIDPATLGQIEAKLKQLNKAIEEIKKPDHKPDVQIYAKAVEWIVRHGEWYGKEPGKQTLMVLDAGLARAAAAKEGNAPWRDIRNRPVARGYQSRIDGSIQPYSVTIPEGYGIGDKKWRLDIVLHGRDQTLTEVKFLASRETAKPSAKGNDFIVIEPYGRGNNAYRWAGETDVKEAVLSWVESQNIPENPPHLDHSQVVLRGFSMGGAGTWHLGLHHPFSFSVIGPGAGFSTTRGYIKNLPAQLPDYQERTLRIYDAVGYAENAYNVPIVAYSGEKDPQKAAADNIENALKGFDRPRSFTHLIAPNLEHQMPAEWQAKAEAEYRKHLGKRTIPEKVHFVTYTTRYSDFGHGHVEALEKHYDKATIDSHWTKEQLTITTKNIRALIVVPSHNMIPSKITIDQQSIPAPQERNNDLFLIKVDGKWTVSDRGVWMKVPAKRAGRMGSTQGPIDDAFTDRFTVIGPSGQPWFPEVGSSANAAMKRFAVEWDKHFRGTLPTANDNDVPKSGHLVLFGDPGSNPTLAKMLPKLPMTWTKTELIVNGVKYDPTQHLPVMIFPRPDNPRYYVVINSGHTFHDADLKGTNALLYPRLGDWAVLKVAPTAKDPAAAEVVTAGLFDESWKFPQP